MNQEDIIRLAREAWFGDGPENVHVPKELERFAALVAAAEREACAQFLESTNLSQLPDTTALHYARLLKGFAEGIRTRKDNT